MVGSTSNWKEQQIVDVKLDEVDGEIVNFIRVRSMRETGFESRWRRLKIGENFEVTLEK